jgi:hypothetical protein
MKKINKVQKVIGFMMLLLVISMVVYVVLILLPNKKTNMSPDDTIKFGYTSYKRDTKLYKDTFDSLGKVLDKEPIDYEEYAKYLSELFIIDFYTLDNKNDKNDIGGIQFIYDDLKDNFILNASDTVYKYIKNITSSKNRQLPVVSKINVSDISENTYKIENTEYSSYIVTLDWSYEKDYGYETSTKITLIKKDNKLFIVEKVSNNE